MSRDDKDGRQWGEGPEGDSDVMAYINQHHLLMSLLYDLDLLPEQHMGKPRDGKEWCSIFAITNHWREAELARSSIAAPFVPNEKMIAAGTKETYDGQGEGTARLEAVRVWQAMYTALYGENAALPECATINAAGQTTDGRTGHSAPDATGEMAAPAAPTPAALSAEHPAIALLRKLLPFYMPITPRLSRPMVEGWLKEYNAALASLQPPAQGSTELVKREPHEMIPRPYDFATALSRQPSQQGPSEEAARSASAEPKQVAWVATDHGGQSVLFWKHERDQEWVAEHYPNARPLYEAPLSSSALHKDQVEWVVNDNAELGVKIGNQFFWLYKGHSLVYGDSDFPMKEEDDGVCKHDDGKPMHWRPVFKREFGECCHPVNYADLRACGHPHYIGTVDLKDSDEWKPLPTARSASAAQEKPGG